MEGERSLVILEDGSCELGSLDLALKFDLTLSLGGDKKTFVLKRLEIRGFVNHTTQFVAESAKCYIEFGRRSGDVLGVTIVSEVVPRFQLVFELSKSALPVTHEAATVPERA